MSLPKERRSLRHTKAAVGCVVMQALFKQHPNTFSYQLRAQSQTVAHPGIASHPAKTIHIRTRHKEILLETGQVFNGEAQSFVTFSMHMCRD